MNAVDHNNVVIFDDRGIPSIMCRFVRPKDTEEVPAVFKIGDKVADAIYISKYPNIVIDGRAYSMPMADPTVNITFDGDTMQGVLRKTGTEEVRNNPNLYLKGGYYFLSHKDTYVCKSCLFRVSHIKSLKVLQEE